MLSMTNPLLDRDIICPCNCKQNKARSFSFIPKQNKIRYKIIKQLLQLDKKNRVIQLPM